MPRQAKPATPFDPVADEKRKNEELSVLIKLASGDLSAGGPPKPKPTRPPGPSLVTIGELAAIKQKHADAIAAARAKTAAKLPTTEMRESQGNVARADLWRPFVG